MYQEYFGLAERPFSETPNPKFLYLSANHREGLAHLEFNIKDGKGFTVLTGEVGTGKTTLCQALSNRLDPEHFVVARVIHTNLDFGEFLREVVDELGLTVERPEKWDLLKVLNEYLIEMYRQNRKVVLIVDEAQNLTPPVLEGIRMLSNLETPQDKLIQIVFVGQPGLLEQIHRPEMVQLKQRIAGFYVLGSLTSQETGEYVAFRMGRVQDKPSLRFTPEALNLIYELSGGIPRLINFLCDFSLVHAFVEESWTVNAMLVQKAFLDLRGSWEDDAFWQGKEPRLRGKLTGWRTESAAVPALLRSEPFFGAGKAEGGSEELLLPLEEEPDFIPSQKIMGRKIVAVLSVLLTLGGLGSYLLWEMTGALQWEPKPKEAGYRVQLSVSDSGEEPSAKDLSYDKKKTVQGPGEPEPGNTH